MRTGLQGTNYCFDRLQRKSAKPINHRLVIFETDDGGFNSNIACTPVEDVWDAFTQLLVYMLRRGRAHVAERIGAWGREWERKFFQQLAGEGMVRTSDANRVEASAGQVRN